MGQKLRKHVSFSENWSTNMSNNMSQDSDFQKIQKYPLNHKVGDNNICEYFD